VEQGLEPGYTPPAFSGKDLEGKRHTLDQYKGNYVVLHFWATWCPYCRQEIPKLTQVYDEYSDQGVKVLAVSVDEDLNGLRAFVKEKQLPYTVVADVHSDFSAAKAYRVAGIPMTYIIEPDGTILQGFQGPSTIDAFFDRLMGQEGSGTSH
jgi:peroxiredoxin